MHTITYNHRAIVATTQEGATRREAAQAAGFKSANAVQQILRRAGLVALVLLVVAASSASARTIIDPESDHPFRYQRWVDKSYVETASEEITVIEENCPGVDGSKACTNARGNTVWMSRFGEVLTKAERPMRYQRLAFLHELGHRFDYSVMTDAHRDWFRQTIGTDRPWRAEGGNSPHETFGEAYMGCALKRRAARWSYGYGYEPTKSQHRRACRVIREAAAYRARQRIRS